MELGGSCGMAAAKSALVTSARHDSRRVNIPWLLPNVSVRRRVFIVDATKRTDRNRTNGSWFNRGIRGSDATWKVATDPAAFHSHLARFGGKLETVIAKWIESRRVQQKKPVLVYRWSLKRANVKGIVGAEWKIRGIISRSLYRGKIVTPHFYSYFIIPKVITSTSLPYVPQICANIHRHARPRLSPLSDTCSRPRGREGEIFFPNKTECIPRNLNEISTGPSFLSAS